jgi:hypothetical protein
MTYFQGLFEKQCQTVGAPTQLSFFTATFSILFTILNVPGNVLVILAVAKDPYKNLRTPFQLPDGKSCTCGFDCGNSD